MIMNHVLVVALCYDEQSKLMLINNDNYEGHYHHSIIEAAMTKIHFQND